MSLEGVTGTIYFIVILLVYNEEKMDRLCRRIFLLTFSLTSSGFVLLVYCYYLAVSIRDDKAGGGGCIAHTNKQTHFFRNITLKRLFYNNCGEIFWVIKQSAAFLSQAYALSKFRSAVPVYGNSSIPMITFKHNGF